MLKMISGEIGHIQGNIAVDVHIKNDIKRKFLI